MYIIKVEKAFLLDGKLRTQVEWYRCNTKYKADKFRRENQTASIITVMTVQEFVNGLKNITNVDDLEILD